MSSEPSETREMQCRNSNCPPERRENTRFSFHCYLGPRHQPISMLGLGSVYPTYPMPIGWANGELNLSVDEKIPGVTAYREMQSDHQAEDVSGYASAPCHRGLKFQFPFPGRV